MGTRATVIWATVLGAIGFAGLVGAVVVVGWMVDETHFERPSPEFDALVADVEALPGVSVEYSERWVEAPSFVSPYAALALAVDDEALPAVIDVLCASGYPERLSTSVRATTGSGTVVSLHDERGGDASACPRFGFDAATVVAALDRAAPGLEVQPAMWSRTFGFSSFEDAAPGFAHLVPLIEHSERLRGAVGLAPETPVAVESMNLSVRFLPEERAGYAALLTELADRGVAVFASSAADEQADGIARIHITAPLAEHAAIERIVRAAGLDISDDELLFTPE